MNALPLNAEWIETDGLGGFASGTVSGIRSRRYHALLLPATNPPAGRVALVNDVEAWIETRDQKFALSSHRYIPDVVHPDGVKHLRTFTVDPWPTWTYELPGGARILRSLIVPRGQPQVMLSWSATGLPPGSMLRVRPMLSGRDYHHTHHENSDFRFEAREGSGVVTWRPYSTLPSIDAAHNGAYAHDPMWFRNFLYEWERARGLDDREDLASPGEFIFPMDRGEAVLIFSARSTPDGDLTDAKTLAATIRQRERARRAAYPTILDRAADAYLVSRGSGLTIVAGYPWFTDWGRDTFISLRGLCLATGRLADARDILLEWSGAVSRGMLPNRFPDSGEAPDYNSVDASLWYVVAVGDFLRTAVIKGFAIDKADLARLSKTVSLIVRGYADGARHGIRLDDDFLLAAGEPGVQLTWMDAKVGDWVVTPRIGKPVEIQALWINALHVADELVGGWAGLAAKGERAFRHRFVHETTGMLADVVDVDHHPGTADWSFRPNQIFAIGGLPVSVMPKAKARHILDEIERRLITPAGLRSLAPDDPAYVPRYEGSMVQRDGAYHQGTVWAWLMGPFVEAWVRARTRKPAVLADARRRFLDPLLAHAMGPGFGHVPEVADGDAPHAWKGCPFQAWSVGETLRLDRVVLRNDDVEYGVAAGSRRTSRT